MGWPGALLLNRLLACQGMAAFMQGCVYSCFQEKCFLKKQLAFNNNLLGVIGLHPLGKVLNGLHSFHRYTLEHRKSNRTWCFFAGQEMSLKEFATGGLDPQFAHWVGIFFWLWS